MAEWTQEITLVQPPALAGLFESLSDLTTSANATLDTAGAALDAAKAFLVGTTSPQASLVATMVTAVEGLIGDLFGAGFYRLVVHPWQHGVGHGVGIFRSLSFPNAVRAIAASFDDPGDLGRPEFSSLAPVEMIVLVAGAPSPAIFKQVVEALLALTGAKELRLAQRRIAQAFRLQATHLARKTGSKLPDWQSTTVRDAFPALAPLEASLREHLAMLKGYAAGGQTSVARAIALIGAKHAQLTALQTRLNAALALFGGGLSHAGVYALHVQGTGGNALLKSALRGAAGAPGPELSFCVAVCWVGTEGSLAALAQALGL